MFERMRANELLESIHSGKIKDGSKINVIYDYEVIDTIEYKNGRLESKDGKFNTRYLCNIEIKFELVKEVVEGDEIETINAYKLMETPYMSQCLQEGRYDTFVELLKQSELEIVERVDDLVYAVRKLIKEREEK